MLLVDIEEVPEAVGEDAEHEAEEDEAGEVEVHAAKDADKGGHGADDAPGDLLSLLVSQDRSELVWHAHVDVSGRSVCDHLEKWAPS